MNYQDINASRLSTENRRSSNFELFRIVMMILLVASHYVHNSGILDIVYGSDITNKSIIISVLGMWGKPIINGFVMITGYFMCKSKIKIEKALKLTLELFFYNIAIYFIFVLTGYTKISFNGILKNILPFRAFSTNFISYFILFYLFIPFINILICNMNQRLHLVIVCLMGTLYVVLGTIPKIKISFNYISWFTFVYLFIAFFRIYREDILNKKKLWLIVFGTTYFASVLSIVGGLFISEKTGGKYIYYFLEDSNKIFALLLAFSMFCVFRNIRLPYIPLINFVAKATLGVLLIHANSDLMRSWLWGDFLKCTTAYETNYYLLHAVMSVLVVYIVCTLIELLRIRLLDSSFQKLSILIKMQFRKIGI